MSPSPHTVGLSLWPVLARYLDRDRKRAVAVSELAAGSGRTWLVGMPAPCFVLRRLPPGTTAVPYSDGLVENRRRGLDAGLDELVSVAAQARPGMVEDPGRLLEYLVDRMLTCYEQDDDVTVLVLHVPRRDDPPGDRGSGGVIPAARRGKV